MKLSTPMVIGLAAVGGVVGYLLATSLASGWAIVLGLTLTVIALGFSLANLRSNRRVTNASAAERDAALTQLPPSGRSRILVYRQGFVGKALGIDVTLDGAVVAQLKAPRFTALDVAPGVHRIGTRLSGTAKLQNRDTEVSVEVAAGETAAVRMEMAMGLGKNQIDLIPVTTVEAAPALRRMTMVLPETIPAAA